MSTIVQIAFAVGEPNGRKTNGAATVPLAAAAGLAALAEEAGVAAIRLLDQASPGDVLDPTVTAAHLSGRGGVGLVVEVPTTGHAPYNTARRVLSLDRAAGGRVGLALRTGEGDEVTDASTPDAAAAQPVRRWQEYAGVLTRLWESFPRGALVGDQESGVIVDDARVAAIDYAGEVYRVAGPLDGPASVQGRPVLVADLDDFRAASAGAAFDAAFAAAPSLAHAADVVVVERGRAASADTVLTEALRNAGRARSEVALLGRVAVAPADPALVARQAEGLLTWVREQGLDGLELVPAGNAAAVAFALRELVPYLADAAPPLSTLRAAFGLPELAEASA